MSNVFIAFQVNEESRPVVDAILADNPNATAVYSPGLVKIDAPNSLVIKRESIEEQLGQRYDLQQMQVNLVTLSGHIDEDDDQFTLSWNH
ncbi:MAG: monooxygenase [Betaproteobacteria bacterium]|jgi:phenol hydroxylase P2 protein|nr:monooxygenase [Betaproteobacteria bacterium]